MWSYGQAQNDRLRFHFSGAADLPNVKSYYASNRHNNVDIRKDDITEQAVKNGRFILVDQKDGTLHAGSAAYDFADPDDDTEPRQWIELGTTRATLPGYGLYPYLISSQVVYDFLDKPPKDRFVAIVDDNNPSVRHLLGVKTGWKEFTASPELETALHQTKSWSSNDPYKWFGATTDTLPHQARLVLDLINKTELVHKNGQDRHFLDFSDFPLANQFRKAVEFLANGPVANHLENNPHMGMAKARDYLEKHMKGQLKSPQPKP